MGQTGPGCGPTEEDGFPVRSGAAALLSCAGSGRLLRDSGFWKGRKEDFTSSIVHWHSVTPTTLRLSYRYLLCTCCVPGTVHGLGTQLQTRLGPLLYGA